MTAIYKRELKSYFTSPIGYVVLALQVAVTALYFTSYCLFNGYPYAAYPLYGTSIILLFTVPFLTMRSMSEDRKTKTDQLLLTAPVSTTSVVLGKYLAMITIYGIADLIYCIYPIAIRLFGDYYATGADYLAILTHFLLACVYIGIGLLISSLCENQIIAVIGTFAALFVLYMWSGILNLLPTTAFSSLVMIFVLLLAAAVVLYYLSRTTLIPGIVAIGGAIIAAVFYLVDDSSFESLVPNALSAFNLSEPFSSIASNQLLDIPGLLLYFSLIFLTLFLTVQGVQRRRWN